MAKKLKKKPEGKLPKESIERLKRPVGPVGQKIARLPEAGQVATKAVRISSITGDPNGKVFGLGEDNKVYLWNFVQGQWIIALQKPTIQEPDPSAESDLDKPQGTPKPAAEDPLG